jgi:6,7-dimethyl-8-ribityllumazine synthase
MPRTIEGHFNAEGLRVAIVVSRFNGFVSERLLEGALDALTRHGAKDEDISIVRVPGAFEIPSVVRQIAQQGDVDAIVVLGTLVRGNTAHFDLISAEVFKGVASISMEFPVAIGMGIITAENLEQAIERGGSKMGNKGFDAAQASVEMANLHRQLGNRETKAGKPRR